MKSVLISFVTFLQIIHFGINKMLWRAQNDIIVSYDDV